MDSSTHALRTAAAALVAGAALVIGTGVASAHGTGGDARHDSPATSSDQSGGQRQSDNRHTGPGDSNAGDVWTDNVGQPSGPGHEQDPHLSCSDINIWAAGLADGSGTYTVDGWPPSGSQEQDYSGNWSYNTSTGGAQVVSVIPVQTLINTAIANGDSPKNKNGFHFKLEFGQDPQKHKTFWVACPAGSAATPSGGVSGPESGNGGTAGDVEDTETGDVESTEAGGVADTTSGSGPAPTPSATSAGTPPTLIVPVPTFGGPTASGGVSGSNASSSPAGGVQGISTVQPAASPSPAHGGVLGISTAVPSTGAAIPAGLALLLLGGGTSLIVAGRRRRGSSSS